MSLRLQAGADLRVILEDSGGFAWDIEVTDPDGVVVALKGFSADIGFTIDPNTGIGVAGRQASVALSIESLVEANLSMPRAIADQSSRPWVVKFLDIVGTSRTYKVAHVMPDRTIGVVTCLLEAYQC